MTEEGTTHQDFETVGVIGAGQMGSGIAQVCATAGYQVRLQDIGEEPLQKAIEAIERNLERQVEKGRRSYAERTAALNRISTDISRESRSHRDLVTEAPTENEENNRPRFHQHCQGT